MIVELGVHKGEAGRVVSLRDLAGACIELRFSAAQLLSAVTLVMAEFGKGRVSRPSKHYLRI